MRRKKRETKLKKKGALLLPSKRGNRQQNTLANRFGKIKEGQKRGAKPLVCGGSPNQKIQKKLSSTG